MLALAYGALYLDLPAHELSRDMTLLRHLLGAVILSILLSQCSGPASPNGLQQKPYKATHVNPFEPGTYPHFRAKSGYPRNYSIWINKEVLAQTNEANSSVRIDLSDQRGYLLNGLKLAMDFPVATGRSAFPTPTGEFQILEKVKSGKRSATYGKIYDAGGVLINDDADSRKDPVPPGGKYVGAEMPYWMRVTWDGIGMHKGRVPRRPASHGCIRIYWKVVATIYSKVKRGTPVKIVP